MDNPRRALVGAGSAVVILVALVSFLVLPRVDPLQSTVRTPAPSLGAPPRSSESADDSSASAAPRWLAVRPLINPPHAGHSATLLEDGRVLVVGGTTSTDGIPIRDAAVLFHPANRTWSVTAALADPVRNFHTATRLTDGRVLVAGGGLENGSERASAEIYDPDSDQWLATGSMLEPRAGHAAALLRDGRVLVVGGAGQPPREPESAEIFDPDTGTWSTVQPMPGPREGLTLTTLTDGRVLAVAGSRAEVFAPETGAWTATGPLTEARGNHVAVLLDDGTVLVAGGGPCCRMTASAEIYDPTTGAWTATESMSEARGWFTASRLPDGTVLAVGGGDGGFSGIDTAERFDPRSGSWSPTVPMLRDRSEHRAVVLADGRVLVVGGYPPQLSPRAELYDPTPTIGPG